MIYTNPEMPLDCACLIIVLGGSVRVESTEAKGGTALAVRPRIAPYALVSAADELPVPGAEAVAGAVVGLVARPVVGARGIYGTRSRNRTDCGKKKSLSR